MWWFGYWEKEERGIIATPVQHRDSRTEKYDDVLGFLGELVYTKRTGSPIDPCSDIQMDI